MADTTITALPAATTPLAGTEVLPIDQAGATVKVAVQDLGVPTAVSTSIAAEASTRASADTSLTSAISSETTSRVSGDSSLSTAVSSETSSRVLGDSSLSTAISAETSSRVSGNTSLTTLTTSLTTAVSTETSTRASADTSLTSSISTETSIRTSADTSLTASISSETSSRVSAVSSLSTVVSTETSTRASADTSLTTSISTETSLRTSVDSSITTILTPVSIRVSSATNITSPLAWNSSNFSQYNATALSNALTINADAGSPVDGQVIVFRFKDDGTARALTWTTGSSNSFRAVGITLPTTTVISKVVYVGCIYNTNATRWDAVATKQEA